MSRFASFLLSLTVLGFAVSTLPAFSQAVTLPQASPHSTLNQTFGISEVTVDYHRPRVNDRDIWGALVPWGYGVAGPAPTKIR